jgi:endoglucanase
MIPGVQYTNGLSHWLEYKPNDPLNNIAVSWHLYPASNACGDSLDPGCYDIVVAPVAQQFPIITGELGESEDESVCGVKQTNIALQWMDTHHISYLEWTWDSGGTWNTGKCAGLPLITSYGGTPKIPNGINYKNHLAAVSASILLLH